MFRDSVPRCGEPMSSIVILGYGVGALIGWLALRVPVLHRNWPKVIRTQLLTSSILVTVVAIWRMTSFDDALWPLFMVLVFAVTLLVSWLITSGPHRSGLAVLHAWSSTANTQFFVFPIAGALVGPAGIAVAVVIDRLGTPLWATYRWMLRRTAPTKQRLRTSFIDQSPLLAVGVGLALHLVGPAPDWTGQLVLWFAPIMAATGAAMFVGSALHPSQRVDPRPGVRLWLRFIALRLVLFTPIIVFAPSEPIRLVAVLCALSIPAFGPAQMSTLYGYADSVVAAANRYGWFIGAAGVVAAVLLTR